MKNIAETPLKYTGSNVVYPKATEDALGLINLLFDFDDQVAAGVNGRMVDNFQYDMPIVLSEGAAYAHIRPLPANDHSNSGMVMCINPAHITPSNGVSNATVDVYRTFLFELDEGTLQEQASFWKRTKIPASAMIYTGGKSIHVLLTLEEPFNSLELYQAFHRTIVQRLSLNFGARPDADTCQPNRTTKIPGFNRPTKDGQPGQDAKLLMLDRRISIEEFKQWQALIGVTQEMIKLNVSQPKRPWQGSLKDKA